MRHSFVRSVKMDKWSEKQIALMRSGGNAALNRFLTDRGVDASGEPAVKYKTAAAELYRLRLDAAADGRDLIDELPAGAEDRCALRNGARAIVFILLGPGDSAAGCWVVLVPMELEL